MIKLEALFPSVLDETHVRAASKTAEPLVDTQVVFPGGLIHKAQTKRRK
jgi:hypothetical protein